MAFPKQELFSNEDQQLSRYGRALGHPARVFILRELERCSVLSAGAIEALVPLSQSAVSDHLRILRLTGFIEVECQGRYNYYSLNTSVLHMAELQLGVLFQVLSSGGMTGNEMILRGAGEVFTAESG